GIGDWSVTGVQMCALPIYDNVGTRARRLDPTAHDNEELAADLALTGEDLRGRDAYRRCHARERGEFGATAGLEQPHTPQECDGSTEESSVGDEEKVGEVTV